MIEQLMEHKLHLVGLAERHRPLNLSLYFQKNKRDPSKKGTIYCYISVQGYRREAVTTSVQCFNKNWNVDTKRIKGKEAKLLNKKLDEFIQHLRNLGDELRLRGLLSPKHLKKALRDGIQSNYTILALFDEVIAEKIAYRKMNPDGLSEMTIRKNQDYRRYLEAYLISIKRTDLQVIEVNRDFGLKFFDWLRYSRQPNLANNTALKAIYALSSVLNIAVGKDILPSNKLSGLNLKKQDKEHFIYLSDDELFRLESHGFTDRNLQVCADMYLLQAYTGMAYTDLARFSYSENVYSARDGTSYIKANRGKTGKEFVVPLVPKAQRILEKHGEDVPKITFRGGKKAKVISLKSYNLNLKLIAKYVGIDKNLTSHTARCTAGMRWYNLGYPERVLEKMMGATMSVLRKHYTKTTPDTVLKIYQQIEKK